MNTLYFKNNVFKNKNPIILFKFFYVWQDEYQILDSILDSKYIGHNFNENIRNSLGL